MKNSLNKKSLLTLTILYFIIILSSFATPGCVVGFRNAKDHVPEEFYYVYVPAAQDTSVYSGNSGRLSTAIRKTLTMRSDLYLTNLHNARWALQVKILDRKQTITAVDFCQNPANPTVGSGSFSCTIIHPEVTGGSSSAPRSFNQPAISPATEQLYLVVEAKAIDLNTGNTMWAKLYAANNIPPVIFDEIGDVGDGRVKTYTEWTPDLHALRYQEAVDNAVQTFANAIADDVQNMVIQAVQKK